MAQIFPNVPAILPTKIPEGYNPMIRKWSFDSSRVGETVTINGKRINKMLTMDINLARDDFRKAVNLHPTGSREAEKAFKANYPCVHACDGCFNKAHLMNPIISVEEVLKVVDQACELGLESVKFLGPGELLANPELFWILDELAKRKLIVGLFTKAAFLGSDALARRYHGLSAEGLTDRLVSDYDNINFLVGFRSVDPDLENRLVPINRSEYRRQNLLEERKKFNYLETRNRAIELLCERGVNAHFKDQRMALICSPVVAENIATAFDLYEWGAERNMPVYLPPTMVSGKGHGREKEARGAQFEAEYIDLAVRVYTWAIRRGVMTREQLEREGAHPYLGGTPCNQLTFGLYINYDGQVWRCPGNDTPDFRVHSNVRDEPLKNIWMASRNYSIQKFNNRCVKDGVSLPERFYDEVPRRVAARLQ